MNTIYKKKAPKKCFVCGSHNIKEGKYRFICRDCGEVL